MQSHKRQHPLPSVGPHGAAPTHISHRLMRAARTGRYPRVTGAARLRGWSAAQTDEEGLSSGSRHDATGIG